MLCDFFKSTRTRPFAVIRTDALQTMHVRLENLKVFKQAVKIRNGVFADWIMNSTSRESSKKWKYRMFRNLIHNVWRFDLLLELNARNGIVNLDKSRDFHWFAKTRCMRVFWHGSHAECARAGEDDLPLVGQLPANWSVAEVSTSLKRSNFAPWQTNIVQLPWLLARNCGEPFAART